MKEQIGIVYKITNITNNKLYIGSTVEYNVRKLHHIRCLKNNTHRNNLLQNAWNKYGEENFKFEILEENVDTNLLLSREQHFLDTYKPYNRKIGYNINPVAGSNLGFKMPESAKEKLRNINLGKKHSLETRKKISEVQKGKKRTFISKYKTSLKTRGELNPAAKLNWSLVKEIRSIRKNGFKLTEISKKFNISNSLVSAICNNKVWKEGEYYVESN
jgi:group I intron endonuclease